MTDPLDFFRVRPKKRRVKIRRNFGVIFTNPSGINKALFYVANAILVLSLAYLSYLYWPLGKAIIKYRELAVKVETGNVTPVPLPTPSISAEDSDTFWIQIPKIQAKADIIANVSASNKNEYLKVLESDVIAQASGSGLPGTSMGKSIYLFAHSTEQGLSVVRNNAVFYLLGEMDNGDVVFVNYRGIIHTYKVYKQLVVNASEVQYLNYSEPNKEVLILQTCWPLGTDWKRLLVFAEKL